MQHETFWHRVRSCLTTATRSAGDLQPDGGLNRKMVVRRYRDAANSKPRILLMTSTLGCGHLRAAQAIQIALLQRAPDATVHMLDWWSLMNAGVAQATRDTYLHLVQEHGDLYERIYALNERTWRAMLSSKEPLPPSVLQLFELLRTLRATPELLDGGCDRYASDRALFSLFCATTSGDKLLVAGGARAKLALLKWSWARLVRRLSQQIDEFAPDVVVSTQMIPAALVSSFKQRRGVPLPSIAVPTDFGVHDFWKQPGTDLYCLGHESLREFPAGLDVRRIACTGLPLMPQFTQPIDVGAARRMLRLAPEAPVILILGGGLGLGVEAVTERLLQTRTPTQLLVLTGHNANADAKLAGLAQQFPSRVRVFDWRERVDIFIRAADLVVGKPGGLTVAELLACGRPLLATCSLHGQEDFNVRFIEQHRAGYLLSDAELATQVDDLLSQPEELAALKASAWSLGRRNGADQIAAQVLARAAAQDQRATEHKKWQLGYER